MTCPAPSPTSATGSSNIWMGTFPITEAPGSTVAYKFLINGSTWESRANRTFTLAASALTLPVAIFNDVPGAQPHERNRIEQHLDGDVSYYRGARKHRGL